MLIKFLAYLITHSDAILTDALESIVNVTAGTFALFSIYLASKPRDLDHPYGHGKIEFVSAGLEGSLIILAGLGMIGKVGYSFFYPPQLAKIDIGLGLTILSTIVNYGISFYLIYLGKKYHSLTLVADGKHIGSDALSSLGLIIGLTLIYLTGWTILDTLLAFIFALLIIRTGLHLVQASVYGVMDRADESLLNEVIEILNVNRKDNWIDFHNLRIIQYGSQLHIDCHVTLPWYWTLERGHQEMEEIEKIIDENMNNRVEIFIHLDSCTYNACKICKISGCKERQHPFEKEITWTLDNVRMNARHLLTDELEEKA